MIWATVSSWSCFCWLYRASPSLAAKRIINLILVLIIWLYGGVNGDLLRESLCHTRVYCTQSPCPCSSPLLTHTSTGDTQTQLCVSLCGVSVSWCAQGLFEPAECLCWVWGLILKAISLFLPSCWGVSFALGNGVSPQSRSSAANLWLQHRATAIPATYHQRHHVGCWQRSVQSKLCFFQSWTRWMDVSLVWMWELDNKEDWEPKNWSFWTVVLEKAPEYLGEQGGQPVSPKRNQP